MVFGQEVSFVIVIMIVIMIFLDFLILALALALTLTFPWPNLAPRPKTLSLIPAIPALQYLSTHPVEAATP